MENRKCKERVLVLMPNGDPYGRGFVATEVKRLGDSLLEEQYGIYRGDIGARPRSFWRSYARKNGFALREC